MFKGRRGALMVGLVPGTVEASPEKGKTAPPPIKAPFWRDLMINFLLLCLYGFFMAVEISEKLKLAKMHGLKKYKAQKLRANISLPVDLYGK